MRDHFASYGELGVRPKRPLTPREEERWWGLSVFDTEPAAEQRSDESPWIGRYIATIEIPPDARVRYQQTSRNPHHFTIWARPEDLLRWVVFVRYLDEVQ